MMNPHEALRRFKEATRGSLQTRAFIIFYPRRPQFFGLSPRELGFLRKIAIIEEKGKIDEGEHL